MTYNEFLSACENVYGNYQSEILKRFTAQFVKENFKEDELESVLSKILLSINPKYKTPPTPADFAAIFTKSPDAEALRYWEELNRKSHSWRDCIVDDIRAQKALEMLGGWLWFCGRSVKDEHGKDIDHWTRKQFVEYFKMYTNDPPEEPIKRLRSNNERDHEPVMIGDCEKCLIGFDKSAGIMKELNFIKGME